MNTVFWESIKMGSTVEFGVHKTLQTEDLGSELKGESLCWCPGRGTACGKALKGEEPCPFRIEGTTGLVVVGRGVWPGCQTM
jgi:hypothetical protein